MKDARERAPRQRNGKMTTGIRNPSNYYLDLLQAFPPRPINNEAELIATQNQINSILDRKRLTQDDRDYLKVLGMLVYQYEAKNEQIPSLEGLDLLNAIINEFDLEAKDLADIFGDKSSLIDVLEGRIKITKIQENKLTERFLV